jgi:hypothetical protein
MRKLFEPNTRAIGNLPGPLACDAVPDSMTCGTPSELRDDLVRLSRRPYQSFVFLLEEPSRPERPSSLEET